MEIFKTVCITFLITLEIFILVWLTFKCMEVEKLTNLSEGLESEIEVLEFEIKKMKSEFEWELSLKSSLLDEAERDVKMWKARSLYPSMPTPPVISAFSDIKRCVGKKDLEQEWESDKILPGQVELATQEFLNTIRPFIYSELVRENGRAVYYQEIYLAKPEKSHYENRS